MKTISANTKKQPLGQHLFAVGYVAHSIINNLLDDKIFAEATYVAGCLHDIGKIDPAFQKWIVDRKSKNKQQDVPDEGQHIEKKTGKFSFENHPRHNEISLLLYYLLNDETYKKINVRNKNYIKHTLYWHHAKPIRKSEFNSIEPIYKKLKKNLSDAEFSVLPQTCEQIITQINKIAGDYFSQDELLVEGFLNTVDDDRVYDIVNTKLPTYKHYSSSNEDIKDYEENINENAKNNLIRAAVISADRGTDKLTFKSI